MHLTQAWADFLPQLVHIAAVSRQVAFQVLF